MASGRPEVRGCGADRWTEKEKKEIKIAPETQKLNWYDIALVPSELEYRLRRREARCRPSPRGYLTSY
jgi:hypothetical protein